MSKNYLYKFKNYECYAKDGTFNNRWNGGVALYINESIPQREITLQTPLQAIAVTVQLKSKITICCIYNSRSMAFSSILLQNLYNQLPQPCLILGDLNGYSPLWGCIQADPRGNMIENFINHCDLAILNNGAPTHPNPINDTAIDLSLCSPTILEEFDWNTIPSVLDSDHYPILLSTEINEPDPSPIRQIKKADWTTFTNSTAWNNFPQDNLSNEDLLQDLYNRINLACDEAIPYTVPSKFYPKPFWTPELTRTRHIRETLYQRYRRNRTIQNKIDWHRARAIHKNKVQIQKEASWKDYISDFDETMPITEICNRIRKLKGLPPKTIRILCNDGDPTISYSTPNEISEALAQNFAKVSSNENYAPEFLPQKIRAESNMPNFGTSNSPYNQPFTIDDLSRVLQTVKDSAPGEDKVHYKMIKNMPICAKEHLVKIFNKFFKESYFPPCWSKSIIIPIAKPGKNPNSPSSYRPIALTSCLCKLFERLLNERLMEFLIMNKVLSPAQSGGQKYRSTMDHLIRLENTIRNAFAVDDHCIAIFFDLERAYDMTWRKGILIDLYNIGMRGLLPKYIAEFLGERRFQVKVGNSTSSEHVQQNGVPQGAVLSVLLFALKINDIVKTLPVNERFVFSLFVDDLQVSYRHPDLQEVGNVLQRTLNNLHTWTIKNGFRFSSLKTKVVHFNKRDRTIALPQLKLNNRTLNYSPSAKFLGLDFDSKLTWSPYLTRLKNECQKLLGIMKMISSQKYGATQNCLMKIYRIYIRSKLEYGAIAYASASSNELKKIDVVANDALRIASGAFKSSPVDSLYVLCDEMKPSERREILTMRFFLKLKASLNNPANKCTTSQNEVLLRNKNQSPFSIRSADIIAKYNLPDLYVKPFFSYLLHRCTTPKYAIPPATLNQDLCKYPKQHTSPAIFKILFRSIIDARYQNFQKIYTDGSKSDDGVGAAAIELTTPSSCLASLPKEASIFTAEAHALQMAIDYISRKQPSPHKNYVIFTDSKSVFVSLNNRNDNPTIRITMHKLHLLQQQRVRVEICWIPSHIGIEGNEKADTKAKEAAKRRAELIPIYYKDYFSTIRSKVESVREEAWQNSHPPSKLRAIKTDLKPWPPYDLSRREEVVINRIRIGHTNLTHNYLMDSETMRIPPICPLCNNSILTISHIFTQCPNLETARRRHFTPPWNLETMLGIYCDPKKVINFLKTCKAFESI